MARMSAPRLVACCALLSVTLSLPSCDGGPGVSRTIVGARHVVLISLDTTRADQFGLYGNQEVRTPRLDALASESIVLDDLMTVVPTTLASHVSLMTGKYPHSHGTPRNGFMVNDGNAMLAEILRERGFTTAGFAGSFALASRFGFTQGFDHFDENFERFAGEQGRQQNERTAEAVTRSVVDWLDTSGVPDRLFLFAHYFDAHAPYEAPAPYETLYDSRGREGLPDWRTLRPTELAHRERDEIAERMALQYAAEISYMDHHVGELLDALRERGILDEALVVVTSDHGENFWEHAASFDHGWNTYETTMRAVGILRLPGGQHGGTRIAGVAASIDLMPSVLRLLEAEWPDDVEGEPIGLLPPPAAPLVRTRFGQATKPWQGVEDDSRWTNIAKARCIREGRYKLIQVPYLGKRELYDVVADPLEQNDLLLDGSDDSIAIADTLGAKLEAWAESAAPLPSRFEPSQREETIERLKALGYLGGE